VISFTKCISKQYIFNTNTQLFPTKVIGPIGPVHEENILGNTPNYTNYLVLVSFLKVGIPHCAVSTVLAVFETLKNIDFHMGDSHF